MVASTISLGHRVTTSGIRHIDTIRRPVDLQPIISHFILYQYKCFYFVSHVSMYDIAMSYGIG